MLTISVCIPCIVKHVPLLQRCIQSIYNQTILPNEVIISISNIEDGELYNIVKFMQGICKLYKNLNIKPLYSKEKRYAGENRNTAISIANGDILTFIDADDFMFVSRIALLRQVFKTTPDCLGVLHYFIENDTTGMNDEKKYNNALVSKYKYSTEIHYGHPTFRREIFNEFSYSSAPRAQDFTLIEDIIKKYMDVLYVYAEPLTCYMSNDSTVYSPVYGISEVAKQETAKLAKQETINPVKQVIDEFANQELEINPINGPTSMSNGIL
jgi:glycosyltransferase involved in cell wall biosynthesis